MRGPGVHFLNRRGSRVPLLNFEEGPRSRVPGSQNLRSRSHGLIFTPSRLDLLPSFKTSVDARVEGLVSNVGYLENRRRNFTQKKYGRKRCLPRTNNFLKIKKNRALYVQSKQFLLLLYFLV